MFDPHLSPLSPRSLGCGGWSVSKGLETVLRVLQLDQTDGDQHQALFLHLHVLPPSCHHLSQEESSPLWRWSTARNGQLTRNPVGSFKWRGCHLWQVEKFVIFIQQLDPGSLLGLGGSSCIGSPPPPPPPPPSSRHSPCTPCYVLPLERPCVNSLQRKIFHYHCYLYIMLVVNFTKKEPAAIPSSGTGRKSFVSGHFRNKTVVYMTVMV